MPYKNSVKAFTTDTFFHIYARGTNKMQIFTDDSDYKKFMYLLKKYLTRNFKEKETINGVELELPVNSVFGKVELYAFALMPNHFHLLLKNITTDGLTCLLRRVLSNYSVYFNKKYDRQGSLFQGNYRAVPIYNEPQLIISFVYVNKNPLAANLVKNLIDYPYCSYKIYKNNLHNKWFIKSKLFRETVDFDNFERYVEKHKDALEEYSEKL